MSVNKYMFINYPLAKFVKFCHTLCNFIRDPYCVEKLQKKSHKYIHVLFAPLLSRHVHKKFTKTRYREEKPWHFIFGKPIFFSLGLSLTTPYSLGLLVWKFYQTFVILCIEFWLRFEPQIRPTRFSINFFIITTRVERMVRLCMKQFDFFPRWILIRLTWNLSRFVPNSVTILTCNFRKELFRGHFS